MTHWTEGFADEDAAEPMVRPYTITGGRTVPERDDLSLITVISAVPAEGADLPRGLQPEHRAILGLCARPLAVAELASALELPVTVTKILLGDLLAAGRVRARPPLAFVQAGGSPDMTILKAVRDGLRRL